MNIQSLNHLDGIAIIGIACRFPGARNVDEFWQNLKNGVESISFFSDDQLISSGIDASTLQDPHYVKAAPILDDVELFDAAFFEYSPREAEFIDPQHRFFLECSWEALESAGYDPTTYKGSVGVYAGAGGSISSYLLAYAGINQNFLGSTGSFQHIGNDKDFLTTRVSFKLNLTGPSVTVQTACSTSLVAVHLACQSLLNGECDMALAGGVTIRVPHKSGYFSQSGGIVSSDGHCRAFDAKAQGTIFGSGVGIVVLKPLANAIADGDCIHAVIKGSAINNDGGGKISYTASSVDGQAQVIAEALAIARVEPETISYIETHGTGTFVGDPLEITALTQAFCANTKKRGFCAVGSVKTNIGHTEAAAGIAGLIKTVLALKHQHLPPSINFSEPNPRIDFDNSPFYVNTTLREWKIDKTPRRSGVNSLGIGGTNAFIVLEEAPLRDAVPRDVERPLHLLSFSAKNQAALQELAVRFAQHLEAELSTALGDICFTANTGRTHFSHRQAVTAASTKEMSQKLLAFMVGQQQAGVHSAALNGSSQPKIAFLFTGQGSQYVGMGRQLYDSQPTFRHILNQCDELLRPYLTQPLLSVLYPEAGMSSPLDQTAYTQPALFALEYALAQLWRSWGIEPSVVMGHSVGEYVAACIAGVFSLEDGLKLVAERGRLLQALPDNGKMVAVFTDAARVAAAVAPYTDTVAIAALNAPENTVISGETVAIESVIETLAVQGINYQYLSVSHAFHSPLTAPMLDAFEQVAQTINYSLPQIGLVSNVTGQLMGEEVAQAQYWRQHIRETVRFSTAITTLHQQGYQLFVEVGPTPILSGIGQRCLPEKAGVWLPSLRKGQEDWQQLLNSLATLYVHGVQVDWTGFDQDYQRCRVPLPTYPFQRKRYWLEAKEQKCAVQNHATPHPWIGRRLSSPLKETQFEAQFSTESLAFLDDHRIYENVVVPGACYVSMILSAAQEVFGVDCCVMEDVVFPQALIIPDNESCTVQLILTPENSQTASFQIFSHAVDAEDEQKFWRLHATGKVRAEQTVLTLPSQTQISVPEVQGRCQNTVSRTEFYKEFYQTRKIDLGSSFHWLDRVWWKPKEALAQMRQAVTELNAYQLHPGLIDSCLQLAIANLPNSTYVPISIDNFRFYGRPQAQLWCHALIHESDHNNQETFTSEVCLFDKSGQVIAEILGLRLKRANREVLQRATHQQFSDWLYEVTWQPMPRVATTTEKQHQSNGVWLTFADSISIIDELAKQLQEQHETCVMVFPGDSYERVEGGFKINPAHPEEFQQLLRDVVETTGLPYRGIIHLWSLEKTPSLAASQVMGCGSVLHLVQALVKLGEATLPRLWIVTQDTQPVEVNSVDLAVSHSTLWGFGRVIAQEHPEVWGGLIDLDSTASKEQVLDLLEEILTPDGEDQVVLRKGQRYVARLDRSHNQKHSSELVRIDSNSTYLITGGLGGLGLKVAQWLVNLGARHLVLVTRSGSSHSAREALCQLKETGARVVVTLADVSQEEQVARVLEHITRSLPPLRGIIHAAGTLDDGVLLQQTWERFVKVMAPKVLGAWHLHTLTQNLHLDFFVLFSSVAALLGSPGQGNYAAANAFLDALANQRKSQGLPALSINWGPWASVGMAASLGSKGERQWTNQGISLIAPQQGIKVLEQLILQQVSAQTGVLRINWAKFLQQIPSGSKLRLLSEFVREVQPKEKAQPHIQERSQLLEQLENTPVNQRKAFVSNYIQQQVIKVLGLASSDSLNLQQGFAQMGLDSLMALELRNNLQNDLKHSLPSTLVFDYPTIEVLVEYLFKKVLLLEPHAGDTKSQQAENELVKVWEELEQLSDDEAEALLVKALDNINGGK